MSYVRPVLLALAFCGACLAGCGGGGGGGGGDDVTAPVEELLGVVVYSALGEGRGFVAEGYFAVLGWQDAQGQGELFAATPALSGLVDGFGSEVTPDLDAAVAGYFSRLTDGVDGILVRGAASIPAGGGGYELGLESGEIFHRHPALPGPDFAGATISRLTLELSRGSVLVGDPSGYALMGLVSYYGQVP